MHAGNNGFVTVWGITFSPMVCVLVLLLAWVVYFLWRGQRQAGRDTFDVWDLIMDTLPDGSRRASIIKITFFIAFGISSWVIVNEEIKATLRPDIFGIYMATWCSSLIAKVIWDKKDPPKLELPGGTRTEG